MKNRDLANLLLKTPENDVKVLVEGKWYLTEDIKEVKNTNGLTAIVVNNPETK